MEAEAWEVGPAKSYEDKRKAAERLAEKLALEMVGVVSIVDVASVEEFVVYVNPSKWLSLSVSNPQALSVGYLYGIVDVKDLSIMVAEVSDIQVATPQSALSKPPIPPAPIPGEESKEPMMDPTLLSSSRMVLKLRPVAVLRPRVELLEGKPIEALRGGLVESAATPPAPGSPVFLPRPEVIESVLFTERVSESDPLLGYLSVIDSPYVAGGRLVEVRIPWRVLVKHVLVTGTTGSGKTSLVKNLMVNVSRDPDAEILVLDASGDYVASALPGYIPRHLIEAHPYRAAILRGYSGGTLQGVHIPSLIVVPWCRGEELEDICEAYKQRLEELVEGVYSRWGIEASVELESVDDARSLCVYAVSVDIEGSERRVKVYVAPRSLELEPLGGELRVTWLASIDPYFTERARDEVRRLERLFTREMKGNLPKPGEYLDSFIEWLESLQSSGRLRSMHIHHQTLEVIFRRLHVWSESGIVDVGKIDLDYTTLEEVRAELGLRAIILDLEYAAAHVTRRSSIDENAVKMLMGVKMLASLLRAAEEGRRKASKTLVVIDEAHLFFPPRSQRGEYSEVLASMITRLARIGRSRGVAMIFSTHREDDVDDAIVTLTNTKVYFRTDVKTAESLRLPSHLRSKLPFFADYAAILASYYIRGGFITLVSGPALPGHRTA